MNKNERICILGAGPAGLAAAMYLQVRGYTNVEVYEKEDKVGGKTVFPVVTSQGKEWAFGADALFGTISYFALREMEIFGGVEHDLTFGISQTFRDAKGAETDSLGYGNITLMQRILEAAKTKKQIRKMDILLQTKYKGYDCYGHVGISKGAFFGLSREMDNHLHRVRGKNQNLKDLALPFAQFCRVNGVERAMPLWLAPMAAAGFGFPDELPAAYVLKRFNMASVFAYHGEELSMWEKGPETIFEAVNQKLLQPAHLGTEVVRVERTGEKVLVTVRDADGERKERFDKLIVTTPLDAFAGLADTDAEENDLFGRICRKKVVQMVASFSANASPKASGFVLENMKAERLGHVVAWKSPEAALAGDAPAMVQALGNHQGLLENLPTEKVLKTMHEDLGVFGYPATEELAVREVTTCPFIACADYADGWYDRLEALQGTRNTYYGGEILSCGSMEDACAVSRDLIGRFF